MVQSLRPVWNWASPVTSSPISLIKVIQMLWMALNKWKWPYNRWLRREGVYFSGLESFWLTHQQPLPFFRPQVLVKHPKYQHSELFRTFSWKYLGNAAVNVTVEDDLPTHHCKLAAVGSHILFATRGFPATNKSAGVLTEFSCMFSWTESDPQPLHEAVELVMMKGRMEEITTLVIKDNGPLEMGSWYLALYFVLKRVLNEGPKLTVSPGKSLPESPWDIAEI